MSDNPLLSHMLQFLLCVLRFVVVATVSPDACYADTSVQAAAPVVGRGLEAAGRSSHQQGLAQSDVGHVDTNE